MYRSADIYSVESGGWPGDWEGRTILALTLLHQITGKEPAYLAEILEELPHHLNEKGYLRQIYAHGELTNSSYPVTAGCCVDCAPHMNPMSVKNRMRCLPKSKRLSGICSCLLSESTKPIRFARKTVWKTEKHPGTSAKESATGTFPPIQAVRISPSMD